MTQFIKMTKNGETIEIHPDALADHQRLGWKEVEPVEDVEKAEVTTEPKAEPKVKPAAKKEK